MSQAAMARQAPAPMAGPRIAPMMGTPKDLDMHWQNFNLKEGVH
jgi:hypothetical protein